MANNLQKEKTYGNSVSDPFFRIDRDSADAWQKKLSNVRIFTDTVHMSGSAQFSAGQFHDLAETLREKVPGEAARAST